MRLALWMEDGRRFEEAFTGDLPALLVRMVDAPPPNSERKALRLERGPWPREIAFHYRHTVAADGVVAVYEQVPW